MRFLFTMSDKRRTEIGRRRTDRPLSALSAFLHARALWRSGETDKLHRKDRTGRPGLAPHPSSVIRSPSSEHGGARRDRTDDLMLAKHALSQLSYGPGRRSRPEVRNRKSEVRKPMSDFRFLSSEFRHWWAWEDLNLRPHAYQARALTN